MNIQKEIYKDKAWLEEKYIIEDKTLQQIADLCGVSKPTINNWTLRLGLRKSTYIPRMTGAWYNKDVLYELYITKGL